MDEITSPAIEDLRRRLDAEITAEAARQERFGVEPERGVIWWEERWGDVWVEFVAMRRSRNWYVQRPPSLPDQSRIASGRWGEITDSLKSAAGRVRNITILPIPTEGTEGAASDR